MSELDELRQRAEKAEAERNKYKAMAEKLAGTLKAIVIHGQHPTHDPVWAAYALDIANDALKLDAQDLLDRERKREAENEALKARLAEVASVLEALSCDIGDPPEFSAYALAVRTVAKEALAAISHKPEPNREHCPACGLLLR